MQQKKGRFKVSTFEDQAIYPGAELFLIKTFMRSEGFAPKQWLLGTGLSEEQLQHADMLMSLRQFDIIYRNIFRLSARADIGLALGRALNLSRWGLLSGALICCKSLGDALETANRFRGLLRSRFTLTPHIRGDRYEITICKREGMDYPLNQQFAHEVLLASLQTQIQQILGENFHFEAVQLSYPQTPYHTLYQSYLACPVQFSAGKSMFAIPRKIMEKALPIGNPVAKHQSIAVAEKEMARVSLIQDGDIGWRVKTVLDHSRNHRMKLDTVAESLNFSPRTLRRKLQQAGTSFKQISDEHLLQQAMQSLEDSSLNVADIAAVCGFKDQVSFREAFKRLSGMTPLGYRKHCQETKLAAK